MSKKNNKSFLWTGIIAVILVAILSLQKKGTSLKRSEKNLAFSGDKFNQLQIRHQGNTLLLKFEDGVWVSEDKNEINTKKINALVNALMSIEIQSKVASSSLAQLNKVIDDNGYAIEIQIDNKSIYQAVFGKDKNQNLIKTSSGKLYYIKLKGYSNLFITELLNTNSANWVDKMLINLSVDEINSVVVEYPDKPTKGFKVNNQGNNLAIESSAGEKIKNINTENANDYLSFFNGIHYELLDTSIYKPSDYLFRLAINTTGKKLIQIDGFELVNVKTLEINTNKFSGIVNNSIMVQLNYSDFDPILVDSDYFQKK